MGLMGNWIDKVDGVDDVLAEDINSIARAVISIEEANGDIDAALDNIIAIQNELLLPKFGLNIDGTVHYFAFGEGMTWSEFIDSDYNVNEDFKEIPNIGNPTASVGSVCYQSEDNVVYDPWGYIQTDWEISTEYNYIVNG